MRKLHVLAGALLLGIPAAALAHGEFESMKGIVGWGLAGAFGLLAVGSILSLWVGARRLGSAVVFCGTCTLVAIPVALFAGRGVVGVDTWRAKRYVTSRLVPHLESVRGSGGGYPREHRLAESPFVDAPWLIRRFQYVSDGRAYTLSVMDPGVCGRITSYSSVTRRWTETDDPCWY